MTVTVVTPWRNHLELADGYWTAIEAGAPDQVIVVDDASDPPLNFGAIRLPEGRGFNGACNVGLAAVETDAVVFLNNDVELVDADWLRRLRNYIRPRTLVGEVRAGHHTILGGVEHPYVAGWCVGAWTEDLIDLGGWDDLEEPAYYGDNLLTLRAEDAGWRVADVRVGLRHLGSRTANDNVWAVQHAAFENRQLWARAVREHQQEAVA